MGEMGENGGWVPEGVRGYLRALGYSCGCAEEMEPFVREWWGWMRAEGPFYSYTDTDGFGRAYEVHRRSLLPAARVCREWGSLLLNDKTQVVCGNQACTDWLASWMAETNFLAQAQACVVRAFGLGTGAWALWADTSRKQVRARCFDARMVVPLSWDEDGVTECAFVTRAWSRGRAVDQLQMHVRGASGYEIRSVLFDSEGKAVEGDGLLGAYETGSPEPTFAVVRPAVENTRVDGSPYGQSVFADALGAVQAVDLAFDALFNEVDVSKMRVFLSDVLFQEGEDAKGRRVRIPFGKQDCTVFRKVMSTEDLVQEFAPALRTESQERALRVALQMLGDLTGFGLSYFDFDNSGYVKTATEVSSDNSALMRNIRRHENLMQGALAQISRAVLAAARRMGEPLPDEGDVEVTFDDSIITDTTAEKAQDMAEVTAGLMHGWEYRAKWYGEDPQTAKASHLELPPSVTSPRAAGPAALG